MAFDIFTVLLIVLLPGLSFILIKKFSILNKLGPVFICYATGIIIANIPGITINNKLVTSLYEASVLFAIPMLLYTVRLADWPKLARKSVLSFLLATIAALIGCFSVSFFFKDLHQVWNLSGMLTGIFVGGTANMQAIGVALGVSNAEFIQLNAAEVAVCGIYLLFLVSIAQKVLQLVLPKYSSEVNKIDNEEGFIEIETKVESASKSKLLKGIINNFGVTIIILLMSSGISFLITSSFINPTAIVILITSLSLMASTIKKVNTLKSGYETAEYLLLMFCTGIGLMADFSLIIKDGLEILLFVGVILSVIFILHLLFCYFFRIDADNMIISSTATIFGPAFIGQVAASIKNKEIIFPGIVISMIGISIANYLGIGIAFFLKYLLLKN